MTTKHAAKAASTPKAASASAQTAASPGRLSDASSYTPIAGLGSEDASKDEMFVRLALVADAMLKAHGKDFTMGTLVLAARFIAEGKPLIIKRAETEARSTE